MDSARSLTYDGEHPELLALDDCLPELNVWSAPSSVMLPHAQPVGGIHDVDRYRSDFAFGSSSNPVQAQSAAAARAWL